VIFLLTVLTVASLASYYEYLRKKSKAVKSWIHEENIFNTYLLPGDKDDRYGFRRKFAAPDKYDMNAIRPFWNNISFLQRVPYTMFHYGGGVSNDVINTNNLGFRGKDRYSHLLSRKPDPNFRYVILLGGSTAFGAYSSSDNKCISAVLEQKLNEGFSQGRRFKVINLAMGFYNSFQELLAYILYGLKYEPEAIVTMDGFNDCAVPLLQHKYVPLVSADFYQARKLIHEANRKALRKKGIIFNTPPNCWDRDEDSQGYEEDVAGLYKRDLDLICLIAQAKGSKVLLTLQPVKALPNGSFAWEDKEVENIYRKLPGIIKEVALRYQGRAIDFQEVFRINPSFNRYFSNDPVHLSDRGQEIVATYMYQEIKKLLKNE